MQERKQLPNLDVLYDLFIYSDGVLIRRKSKSGCKKGDIAGTTNPNGYKCVSIESTIYYIHRIIWKMLKGTEPEYIDHIDGDPGNNKIENLQEVTNAQNSQKSKIRSDNTSGHVGIVKHNKTTWCAYITVDGKQRYLGSFKDINEAIKARQDAELEFFSDQFIPIDRS